MHLIYFFNVLRRPLGLRRSDGSHKDRDILTSRYVGGYSTSRVGRNDRRRSGLATPAKIIAPSLSLPIALEVDRVTFQVFSNVEWISAFFGLSITSVGWRFPAFCWIVLAVVVVLLILQAVWLLPALDARVSAVIAGVPQQPNIANVHMLQLKQ